MNALARIDITVSEVVAELIYHPFVRSLFFTIVINNEVIKCHQQLNKHRGNHAHTFSTQIAYKTFETSTDASQM